jgi:hypothetical protein
MNDIDVHSYTYSRSAIHLLRARFRSRDEATNALLSALKSGFIRSIGFESTSLMSRMHKDRKPIYLQFVPQRFWQNAPESDISSWNWEKGDFSLSAPYSELTGASSAWKDVRFESDRLPELGSPKSQRGRKRSSNWEDWIAAAVVLAADGDIPGSLRESQLQALISDKLDGWDCAPLADSTTIGAARAIMARIRSNE